MFPFILILLGFWKLRPNGLNDFATFKYKAKWFFSMDTILTLEFLLIFLETQLPGDTDGVAIPLD